MASTTTRSLTAQGSQNGAIIKKRSAVPSTRSAFGDLPNGQGLQRQKASANLRKPLATKQGNIQPKPSTANVQKDTSKPIKKPIRENVEKARKPPIEKELPKLPDSPAAMMVESSDTDELCQNIFDLALKPHIDDIDENDADNPQLCSEFVNDIYQYMLYLESTYPIKALYLKDSGLKPRMRSILVDWLIQVHHRFQLLQETLYLTIAVLDRFLQEQSVPRAKLQLAGVTAMLLASKYEEMYAPEVSDFVYITDKAFTQRQILDMEMLMLKTLKFNLGRPLPLHFLRRNSKAGQVDAMEHTLAKYLMELSLVDYDMCHIPPSKLAAAALCLSIKLLEDSEWTETLTHYSTYSKEELQPVVCHLAKNLKSAESSSYQQAVKSKYSSHKLMKISQVEPLKSTLVAVLAGKANDLKL